MDAPADEDDEYRFVRFTFDDDSDGLPFLSGAQDGKARAPKAAAAPALDVARPTSPLPSLVTPKPLVTYLGPGTNAVARIHISQLTPALFDAHHRSVGVPLIIEGALDKAVDWRLPAFVNSFDPEATYQCRIHGGDSFAVSPSKWSGKTHARHVVPTTPRKFAETITSGVAQREDCYVQADISGTSAGRAIEADLERIGARTGMQVHRRYGPIVNMWWGPAGHTEPLHMDATDGTLCQLRGRKTIVLFPPSSWRDLYPFPCTNTGMSWAFSQVVQSAPDFAKFPQLKWALEKRIEVELQEGEVLYIPACCAHEITGELTLADGSPAEHVLSINRFWRTSPVLVRPHMPMDSLKSYNETMAPYE
uniref:JmjC domain-containing protein n=1 Tax=Haptolina brevifila TaxID=156173 RepID=A0A7S2IVI5_9EUKA|mmetsp:Transcript_7243/g.14804  ORF Transcript_7243/g.14804 Transcript_7243/m.14804 type:complete len:363 (+) Transcript_7243:61-1149(+)